MKPLVSLITPVYNAMPYLADYLDSVIYQTWRPLEIILSDDGSTDDSLCCIKEKTVELEKTGITVKLLTGEHRSQSAAVNAALKEAEGEFLTWCDADDIMLPRCIEKKAVFLTENPDIGMVRNDGIIIDGDTLTEISRSTKESDRRTQDIFHELFLQTTYCFAGCYMLRMSLFDSCYPGREIPLSPEGQNLQLLLPPASRTRCGFVPEVLHHYIKRGSGHSSSDKSYTQKRRRALNFTKLYEAILPFCDCDREKYAEEAKQFEKRRMAVLNYSVIARAREEIKKR